MPNDRPPEGAREVRAFKFQFKRDAEKPATLVGYAAIFDSEAHDDFWGNDEVIRSGAFTKTVNEADVRALFNHNPDWILGRNKAGTLRLREDDHGLRYEIDMPDTTYASDLLASVDRGDIDQSSFAFRVVKQTWTEREGKPLLREILEVELYDVSPVTYPFYEGTEVDLQRMVERAKAGTLTVRERALVCELRKATDPEPDQAVHSEEHATTEPAQADHSANIVVLAESYRSRNRMILEVC